MKVMTRAGSDASFRNDCLGTDGRATIEKEAQVTFDPDIVLRCFGDKETAGKEIALLFPDLPVSANAPVKNYWLCTYVDYIPTPKQ